MIVWGLCYKLNSSERFFLKIILFVGSLFLYEIHPGTNKLASLTF